MKLNQNYLSNHTNSDYKEDYENCYNALGLYSSVQFVLRLRYDLHLELEKFENVDVGKYNEFTANEIQAYSTYFHETIHWWQHVGSITGFILSMSYPSQTHINVQHLKEYLKYTGKVKPIRKYNELNATTNTPKDDEFKTINTIVNNYYDIEFFRDLIIKPDLVKKHISNNYFESVGHSYHIAYSSFCNLIASCFDNENKFVPDSNEWLDKFVGLKNDKVDGYYYQSPVLIPPTGVYELFEGQARFSQLQYLHFASGGKLDWNDFEEVKMLTGVYYKSFESFLTLTESNRPASINSPLVALYMLVIDLAINPTDGFPFDILSFDTFIESVDPGVRFYLICMSIKEKFPETKSAIQHYTSSEYFSVSEKLSQSILCYSPLEASSLITKWSKEEESLVNLMLEEQDFQFSDENLPIRLMFSRFIRFQQDKLSNPSFFCWPGFYCAGKVDSESARLFKEHQALFTDKKDGDIYPSILVGKKEENILETFNKFYSWVSVYDLTKQWISKDGDFSYDYFWLTSQYSMDDLETWSDHYFHQIFGTSTKGFSIL
ncbi:hypothetical protein [Vibrio rotiferianus]|uniref:hypothetical protein n=1 Tax=Vibrio rotiferianus TaxID=190895 RepID=UPI003909CF86